LAWAIEGSRGAGRSILSSYKDALIMTASTSATRATALAAVALSGLLGVTGCGDDSGLGKRYSVSGSVTYNGQPVEKGQISFVPADLNKQRAANGFIQDGRYSLTTLTPQDGALPGDYKVTIVSKEADNSQVIKTIMEKGGGARQAEVGKATAIAKDRVPAKYQLPETSQLTAKVEEHANTIDFELKD
jgi:hypothetical protein